YTSNETFNQQIEIAEVVIANKADLYQSNEFPLLVGYVDAKFGLDEKQIYQVRHGAVELEWLARAASEKNQNAFRDAAPINNSSALPPTLDTPKDGFVSADNAGEGFYSRGWIFNPGWQFDSVKLLSLFQGLDVERLKGVFITSEGFIGFNKVDDVVTQLRFNFMPDSRVEVISRQQEILAGLEKSLLDCRINSRASG
ncbi:MAG: GTP-binding protein, partial [Pseudomonadota bacterium]|nr:GTP-binding protein [Pseudomonadota bacterium]